MTLAAAWALASHAASNPAAMPSWMICSIACVRVLTCVLTHYLALSFLRNCETRSEWYEIAFIIFLLTLIAVQSLLHNESMTYGISSRCAHSGRQSLGTKVGPPVTAIQTVETQRKRNQRTTPVRSPKDRPCQRGVLFFS